MSQQNSGKGGKTALSKVSTLAFVGMTCALAVSIRNIPDVASTGWTMFFYMLVAAVAFGFPIALIAGEFTTSYPGAGGPELWNTKSLSGRWGFTTSWLLWVQMFPGMVMVASVLAPLAGYVINDVSLGLNNVFTLVCILVVYWGVTFLNMRFDMSKIGGKIGIWLGLYIPIVAMFLLGVFACAKTGLLEGGTLGAFSWDKLIPDSTTWSTMAMFSTIIFIFTGIEMSSVYVQRLTKPDKQYPVGIFVSLLLMLVFNVANAVLVSNVVPAGEMQLNNITQAVAVYVQVLGLPSWIVNVFAAMVFVGVVVQLSGWVSGPSQTITASARRGNYPPKWRFWKTNKYGLANTVLIVQAVVISLFSGVYLLIPAINTAFVMLVNATSLMYCLVYVMMAIGIIRLRKVAPGLKRPFRIGKHGNGLCYAVAGLLLATIVAANVMTYATSSLVNNVVVTAVTVVLFVIPLVIYKYQKADWKTEVDAEMAKAGIVVPSEEATEEVPAEAQGVAAVSGSDAGKKLLAAKAASGAAGAVAAVAAASTPRKHATTTAAAHR
ncbi:MAG: amino acid permease [Eggerthellaceae bacterium]|jgi:amino acid transporter|nr:amino acid permease [Eggerthellaceae bacterium]